jgi:prephenate dehydrogenase
MNFGTVAIVGVGLIGGSVGHALRRRGLARRVVGLGRDTGRLDLARRLGALDAAETDPRRAFGEAEVVVVCTPVGRIADDVGQAARLGPPDLLVTDAGSTKRRIVERVAADARAAAVFVGAHPIAGSERSGVEHARADLFEGSACVLTPTPRTPESATTRAEQFWSALGCRVVRLDADAHDRALALASHLPHALAAALAGSVPTSAHALAAGAFRDGTRVAAADPDLWTQIFLENQAPVLDALDRLSKQLDAFRRLLAGGDAEGLSCWWGEARTRRLAFLEQQAALAASESTSEDPF